MTPDYEQVERLQAHQASLHAMLEEQQQHRERLRDYAEGSAAFERVALAISNLQKNIDRTQKLIGAELEGRPPEKDNGCESSLWEAGSPTPVQKIGLDPKGPISGARGLPWVTRLDLFVLLALVLDAYAFFRIAEAMRSAADADGLAFARRCLWAVMAQTVVTALLPIVARRHSRKRSSE